MLLVIFISCCNAEYVLLTCNLFHDFVGAVLCVGIKKECSIEFYIIVAYYTYCTVGQNIHHPGVFTFPISHELNGGTVNLEMLAYRSNCIKVTTYDCNHPWVYMCLIAAKT